MTVRRDTTMEAAEARIIEVIGLAGTGKSTTCRWLRQNLVGAMPEFSVNRLAVFQRTVKTMASGVVRHGLGSIRDPEGGLVGLKFVAHFDSMSAALLARRRNPGGLTVLDQGPIFNYVWSKRACRHEQVRDWIPSQIGEYFEERAEFLSSVVVLDAPDEILFDRIARRSQDHEIKGADASTSAAFVAEYRELYAAAIDELRSWTGIEPLSISTEYDSVEEVGKKISRALSIPLRANDERQSGALG
jgi:hypothetical protein